MDQSQTSKARDTLAKSTLLKLELHHPKTWRFSWLQAMNRVRSIVYLDGGFTPSETKTALAVDKPFNRALMMLGEKDEVVAKTTAKGVKVKMRVLTSGRSGPRWDEVTNIGKLAEQYRSWVFNQHRLLDDEVRRVVQTVNCRF